MSKPIIKKAKAIPAPLGFTTGYSPTIDTSASLGASYFAPAGPGNGGGGGAEDWSLYPALEAVDMGGQAINNSARVTCTAVLASQSVDCLGTASFGVGATVTVNGPLDVRNNTEGAGTLNLFDTGGVAHPVTVTTGGALEVDGTPVGGGGDPSTWSTYDATQNVNIASNNLTNVAVMGASTVNVTNAVNCGALSVGTPSPLVPAIIKMTDSAGAIWFVRVSTAGVLTVTSF